MIYKLCNTTGKDYECWELESGKKKVKMEIFLEKKTYSISWIGKADNELVLDAKRFINTCVENYAKSNISK